jgi:hypothetical protein
MNKRFSFSILFLLTAFLFTVALKAQTTVTVQVKEDGKMVKDTTYRFENAGEAEQAVEMMEIAGHGGNRTKAMVFISEDGKKTEIKEITGDSLVWVSEGDHDGKHVKVMKYKFEGDNADGKHVMIMKSGDGENFDILIDEDGDDPMIKEKKNMKVIVSEGEEGEWQVIEKEMGDVEKEIQVLTGDEAEVEIEKILEANGESEDVKVIVIRKKDNSDCIKEKETEVEVNVHQKPEKKSKKQ